MRDAWEEVCVLCVTSQLGTTVLPEPCPAGCLMQQPFLVKLHFFPHMFSCQFTVVRASVICAQGPDFKPLLLLDLYNWIVACSY